MTYNLTLTIRDERGSTKLKLIDIDGEQLAKNPLLAPLVVIHEQAMSKSGPEELADTSRDAEISGGGEAQNKFLNVWEERRRKSPLPED